MAETNEENPPGRLLFTDFDASGKGRPVAELHDLQTSQAQPALLDPTVLSLEELASSLGLDFEDDGEPAAEPEQTFAPDDSLEEDAPDTPEQGSDDGTEIDLDLPSPATSPFADIVVPPLPDSFAWNENDAPSWDQYAESFASARPAIDYRPTRQEREEESVSQYPTDYYPMVEDELYGPGIDAALFDEDDSNVDILSVIPPAPAMISGDQEQVHRPFIGKWRGDRLGVAAPRPTPYGGIKRLREWYRPPEPGQEQEGVVPVEDWYEPPEDYLPGDRIAPSPRDEEGTETLLEMALDEIHPEADDSRYEQTSIELPGKTDILPRDSRDRQEESTRNLDLFDDVDIDAMWDEKNSAERKESTTSRFTSPTRDQDIFAGIDIDEAWSKKVDASLKPEDTVILGQGQMDDRVTVILSEKDINRRLHEPAQSFGDNAPSKTAPAAPPAEWENMYQETRKLGSDNPDLIEADDAIGFLDDLDELATVETPAEPAKESSPPKQKKAAAKAGKKSKQKQPIPEPEEELNLDALIAESEPSGTRIRADVAPPAIRDNDISVDTQRMERKIQGLPETGEEDDPYGIKAPPPPPDAVAAPKVSDEDLAMPDDAATGEKSGTRVMNDLFGKRSGGEESGEEGEAETGDESEAEEDAAVNPMDVFANMDDMDFAGDGLDDEMRAMLEDDEEGEADEDEMEGAATVAEPVPADFKGKVFFYARKVRRFLFTKGLFKRFLDMIAWRENWWFYCDLVAALIASASLAIILSYYIWYR